MSEVRDARGWVLVALVALLADVAGAVISFAMIFSGFWFVAVLGILGLLGTGLVSVLLWDMLRECWGDLQKAQERNKPVVVVTGTVDADPDRVVEALAKSHEDLVKRGGLR